MLRVALNRLAISRSFSRFQSSHAPHHDSCHHHIVFLGPPGCGKGTYSSRVSTALGIPAISTGDLLRAEIASKSPRGLSVKELLAEGRFVAEDLITSVLEERLQKPDAGKGFILDGYPRTVSQAYALERIAVPSRVFLLELRQDVIVRKMEGRRVCSNCGAGYNMVAVEEPGIYMPAMLPRIDGKCDKCHGDVVHRTDDKPEIVQKRLELYYREVQPILNYYNQKNLLTRFDVAGGLKTRLNALVETIQHRQIPDVDSQ